VFIMERPFPSQGRSRSLAHTAKGQGRPCLLASRYDDSGECVHRVDGNVFTSSLDEQLFKIPTQFNSPRPVDGNEFSVVFRDVPMARGRLHRPPGAVCTPAPNYLFARSPLCSCLLYLPPPPLHSGTQLCPREALAPTQTSPPTLKPPSCRSPYTTFSPSHTRPLLGPKP